MQGVMLSVFLGARRKVSVVVSMKRSIESEQPERLAVASVVDDLGNDLTERFSQLAVKEGFDLTEFVGSKALWQRFKETNG